MILLFAPIRIRKPIGIVIGIRVSVEIPSRTRIHIHRIGAQERPGLRVIIALLQVVQAGAASRPSASAMSRFMASSPRPEPPAVRRAAPRPRAYARCVSTVAGLGSSSFRTPPRFIRAALGGQGAGCEHRGMDRWASRGERKRTRRRRFSSNRNVSANSRVHASAWSAKCSIPCLRRRADAQIYLMVTETAADSATICGLADGRGTANVACTVYVPGRKQ